MQKIREKSLVIKSERLIGLLKRENAGKGGGLYKERRKCILMSRIEFPDPKLVKTPHMDITKFLKKCPKMREKNGENFSLQFLILIK